MTPRKEGYVVDENGCWIWQGNRRRDGYGRTYRNGRLRYAHIWFWEQVNGPVPEGKMLDHLCRNPSCIRPDHLEAVSNALNTRRGLRAKLTPEEVEYIRSVPRTYGSRKALAREFNVQPLTISRIRNGSRWGTTD